MLHARAAVAASHPDLSFDVDLPVAEPEPVFRFCVRAVAEPSVLPRVLEMFTLRNLIPQQVQCRVCRDCPDEMELQVLAGSLTEVQAGTIAARMNNLVPVLHVGLEQATA